MKKFLKEINQNYFLNKPIPGLEEYIVTEYITQGDNAFVFKAKAKNLKRDLACKIIPRGNQASNWIEEVQKANILDHPSVVKCHLAGEWIDEKNDIDCLCLVLDFVDGWSIKEYISNQKTDISIDFIEVLLKTIFGLLYEMQGRGIDHGDFHSGNILVEKPKEYSLTPQLNFRVTDFAVKQASFDLGSEDDYLELAKTLSTLLKAVDYTQCEMRDRFAFNFIKDTLLRHLIEKDKTRDSLAENPEGLYELLDSIDEECSKSSVSMEKIELTTPFDYLSCEQMGGADSILKVLFSDRFIGFNDIEDKNNIVLTGPRGCGKSTIFKSLSLKHRSLTESDLPNAVKYFGITYRCDDLYFAFPRFIKPLNQEGIDVPIHFLTVTLLRSILESIELWSKKYFSVKFSQYEEKISSQIWEMTGIKKPDTPNADTFKALIYRFGKERERARAKRSFLNDTKQKFEGYFGVEVLTKCCDLILNGMPFLEKKPFYFFIDDYSTPKITVELQKNLNRLLMIRESSAFFKISTESPISFINEDIDGKAYVEGREYALINLGLNFINGESKSNLAFIEDILTRRLNAVPDFPVKSLEELIGENKILDGNKAANLIRNGKNLEYWGKTALSKICSGDIFYVIKLVGLMVSFAGDKKGLSENSLTPKIKPKHQNAAIRQEAGGFLKNLRELPNGEHLIEIITAFCAVAKSYIKFKDSKNVEGTPPHQASRIELLEEPKLSPDAKKYYDELLRYSVFFEDVRGKSRRGKIVPRLLLRRFLIPHFRLTFSKRDNIGMEPSELETLLLNPNQFEKDRAFTKFQDNDSKEEKGGKQENGPTTLQGELFIDSDPTK